MKKILTLGAALLALTLCLAGCGGQTAEQPDPAPTGQEETATDPELALYGSDGATIALLGDVDGLAALDVQLETDPDAEPIHQEGDAWMTYTCPGLTATGYRTAATGAVGLARIDTTREDLATHRGIAVGATREEVQAAYGDSLRDEPYWDEQGDYLWYGTEGGFGGAILFRFQGDQVSELVLNWIVD